MSVVVSTVWLMATFAVRLVHGPGWDANRPIRAQDAWDQHAAFMDQLADDGFVVAGGPVGNGEETLHLVEAAAESEIRARLAEDPWASAGLLEIGTIEAWALWLDSRRTGPISATAPPSSSPRTRGRRSSSSPRSRSDRRSPGQRAVVSKFE